MATDKKMNIAIKKATSKKKNPGVHSKKRHSNLKTSKLYKKSYKGQGRV